MYTLQKIYVFFLSFGNLFKYSVVSSCCVQVKMYKAYTQYLRGIQVYFQNISLFLRKNAKTLLNHYMGENIAELKTFEKFRTKIIFDKDNH